MVSCRGRIGPQRPVLYMAPDDPLLMIEDAPGRFREEWVQYAAEGEVEVVRSDNLVAVRIGRVSGLVMSLDDTVSGRVWHDEGTVVVGGG